jgi:Family of unknown function (DUF6586)
MNSLEFLQNSEHKLHGALEFIQLARSEKLQNQSSSQTLYRQTALIYLKLTLEAYLLELGHYYQSEPDQHTTNLEALVSRLAAREVQAPELKELQALRQDPNSWISLVEQSYNQFLYSSVATQSLAQPLSFKNSNNTVHSRLPSADELANCAAALQRLMARQRIQLQEW